MNITLVELRIITRRLSHNSRMEKLCEMVVYEASSL